MCLTASKTSNNSGTEIAHAPPTRLSATRFPCRNFVRTTTATLHLDTRPRARRNASGRPAEHPGQRKAASRAHTARTSVRTMAKVGPTAAALCDTVFS